MYCGTFSHGQGHADGLRHAGQRPDRHPGRPHHARRRRHRPGAAGRWHRRLAVAPARRLGDPPGHRSGGGAGAATCRASCSRPTSPTSSSTPRRAPSAWPVCRQRRSRGQSLRLARGGARREPLSADNIFDAGGCVVPVRRPHRRRRGRHRDRAGAADPSRRRRRLRHGDQPDVGRGPAARRDRIGHRTGSVRGGQVRRRRQPDHVQLRRLRIAVGRRDAELRGALDRDAVAAQPARRQGDRRSGDDRFDAGDPERRDRRRRPPRRAPHRHAVHAGEGVGGDRGGTHRRRRPVARPTGDLRHPAAGASTSTPKPQPPPTGSDSAHWAT